MSEGANLIEEWRALSVEKDRLYKEYSGKCFLIDIRHAKRTKDLFDQCKETGHIIEIAMSAVANFANVQYKDIQFDDTYKNNAWLVLTDWLDLHCKGQYILFEPNFGYTPTMPSDEDETDYSGWTPVGSDFSVSVWFADPRDATRFKLTWL